MNLKKMFYTNTSSLNIYERGNLVEKYSYIL
nr:MAG TPA: hypothetical protein [Caudoviricetes sp.]